MKEIEPIKPSQFLSTISTSFKVDEEFPMETVKNYIIEQLEENK